jgi:hypothetical protein
MLKSGRALPSNSARSSRRGSLPYASRRAYVVEERVLHVGTIWKVAREGGPKDLVRAESQILELTLQLSPLNRRQTAGSAYTPQSTGSSWSTSHSRTPIS